MTLFIQPNPSASAGVELFTCRDEAIEISGSADNFTSLMWSGGQGTWENATKLNPTYTPKIDEPGTIQIKLTAQAIGPCLVADVSTTTINLWDLPTTQITGQETVCRNSKDILYVADVLADADYSWTVDQGTYVNVSEDTIRVNWNAEAETSGSVKLTTTFKSTGCSFEADAYNVEISQDNAPDLDAIVGKGSCGTNSNPVVLICSNPGLDYQWFKKDGDLMNNDTGQFYYLHKEERQAGGVFYVRATNKSNALCDNFSNEVDIKPSSKSIEIDSEFSIFPNPASNEISITLNTEKINNTQGLTMQFHTLTGEWIKTIPLDSFFKTINVSELKQGIYTLSLYDEWKMLNIKKLIIVE